ncbi:HNH endonuclease signature motif containing protein [Nocardioides aestuarii]
MNQALASLRTALDDLGDLRLSTVTEGEVVELVDALTEAQSRLTSSLGRSLREADRRRVGDAIGARTTGGWWAHRSRVTRGEAGRVCGLAERLDTDLHEPVADALLDGWLRVDQADVITRAVDALPADLVDLPIRREARDSLLAHAREHDARALRILGKRVLDVVAPDVGEKHEQRKLEEEEARALATASFTLIDDGHGRCHGRFTLPTLHGRLLKEHLHALASPRRHQTSGETPRPAPLATPLALGQALMEYVESYPVDKLPASAGTGLSLTVTLDLDTLVRGVGAASLTTGERISASEARRLACRAGIVPAVLGSASETLDLGRTARLFSPAQRRALVLRDRGCTADGCGLPPGLCHAHHDQPWSRRGTTDLTNGRLLCPRHHRLAHDPRYRMETAADHTVTFHRRT